MNKPYGLECPVVGLAYSLARYADEYHNRTGIEVGEDHYSDDYFGDMLRALVALLNCDTGGLDCGTMDRALRELAKNVGLDSDTFGASTPRRYVRR